MPYNNGEKREYPQGVKLSEIIEDIKKDYKYEVSKKIRVFEYLNFRVSKKRLFLCRNSNFLKI